MPRPMVRLLAAALLLVAGYAHALAQAAGLPYVGIAVHRFPDGESRLRLPAELPGRVVIYRSLDHPNEKLVELALASATARDLGASDLTLVRADLNAAADAIRLSRRTLAVIKGNLFWAFAYNVAAIPLAMAWMLSPVVASAAMAFSSVFVVTNSLRLRRFRALAPDAT